MADYYPLIARAIAGLEKNTGEARRAHPQIRFVKASFSESAEESWCTIFQNLTARTEDIGIGVEQGGQRH